MCIRDSKNIILVSDLRAAGKTVERNGSASLHEMGDGVALFEVHAKIGELTLENDFLESALTQAGLLSATR